MSAPDASSTAPSGLPFQKRVVEWLMACFSMEVCRDGIERNHRFLEEALELVQSLECTRSEAHQLVDYVFDRPVGEPMQELGGSLVTLVALANCHDMDVMEAGETELARVWTKIDKIRAKQVAKPKHSPLPQHVDAAQGSPQCGKSHTPSAATIAAMEELAQPLPAGDKDGAVAYRYRMRDNPDMDWRYSASDMSSKSYLCEPLFAAPQPASNAYSAMNPPPLVKGTVYHLYNYGLAEYLGIDIFHGETTHKFRTGQGPRYIKPEALASAMSSTHDGSGA